MECIDQKTLSAKVFRVANNLGLHPFPDPIGHFGGRPFWILQVFYVSVVWFWLACSQHSAGLPGGRVDGQGLAPGGVGVTLFDGIVWEALYT